MAPEIDINMWGGGPEVFEYMFNERKLASLSHPKLGPLFNDEITQQIHKIFRRLPDPCTLRLHLHEDLLERLGGPDNVRQALEQMQRLSPAGQNKGVGPGQADRPSPDRGSPR